MMIKTQGKGNPINTILISEFQTSMLFVCMRTKSLLKANFVQQLPHRMAGQIQW